MTEEINLECEGLSERVKEKRVREKEAWLRSLYLV